MRSAKIVAALLTMLVLSMSSCCKKPIIKPVQHDIEESDLTTWPRDCTKNENGTWTCKSETLSWVYHNMVDLFYDWEQAIADKKHAEEKAHLQLEYCQADLNSIWCKWWVWALIGAAAGAATTTGIILCR